MGTLCPGAAHSLHPLATRCPSLGARPCPGGCQSHLRNAQSRGEKSYFGTKRVVGTLPALSHQSPLQSLSSSGLAPPYPFLGSSYFSLLQPRAGLRLVPCDQGVHDSLATRPGWGCHPGAIPKVEGAEAPAIASQGPVQLSAPSNGAGSLSFLIHSFHCRSLHGLLQGDPDRAALAPYRAAAGAMGPWVGWRPSPCEEREPATCDGELTALRGPWLGYVRGPLSVVAVHFGLSGRVQVA